MFQQVRGTEVNHFIFYISLVYYTILNSCPVLNPSLAPDTLVAPGDSAGWTLHALPVHDGRLVTVCSVLLWQRTCSVWRERRLHWEFQGEFHALSLLKLNKNNCTDYVELFSLIFVESDQSTQPFFGHAGGTQEDEWGCVAEAKGTKKKIIIR